MMKSHGSGIAVNINAHDGHGHSCSPGHDVLRVLDLAARDALSVCYRYEGLWVEVLTERKFYRLIGGLTNDCWVSCGHGGGDGDISPDDLPIASKTQKGIVQIGDNINVDADGFIAIPVAADDTAGVVELASAEETKAGTDNSKAVTPAGLAEALVQDKVDNPLPVASKTQKGIVQIGDNINVDADGLIAIPVAADDTAGVVELASAEETKAGTINSKAVTPAGLAEALVQNKMDNPLPIASKTQKGIVQIGDNINVDADGLIAVPAASDSTAGVVELASVEETKAGTDNSKAVTPAGLADALVQDKVDNRLPIASKTQKGIVQIGDNISVDVDGLIAVPAASDSTAGVVELASVEEVKAGTDNGKAVTPANVKAVLAQFKIDNPIPVMPGNATTTKAGVIKIGSGLTVTNDGTLSASNLGASTLITLTSSTTWTAPATGMYRITCLGGGGGGASYGVAGTAGGKTSFGTYVSANGGLSNTASRGGAGGYTGGSGDNGSNGGGTGGSGGGVGGGVGGAKNGGAGGHASLPGGGGGGGGGNGYGGCNGGGGGGSGYTATKYVSLTKGTAVTITIGAGGTGGAASNGGAGGNGKSGSVEIEY